ncbi:hypothetical protein DFH08DRAFT_872354 [Mycena albidolilacea]|uniref:DUF3074 domain-containing protein n=1 Tax=Mycena albidolilacea TaxID=1033008 RepID=A0AAD6ZX08_9AGAR|nr:hypothetical protein DFH08DRAFT_872354 [Mycena albidolilacea]
MLSITPLKLSAIPSDEEVLKAADALLESTSSWKEGKTFHKQVKTLHRAKGSEDGAAWHARVSIHKPAEATFTQMWSKLGEDKALNEMKFIPNIKKVTKVKEISATQSVWTLYYTFPPPIAPRVFTVVQITRLNDSSPRSGTIVSIPVDLSEDQELAKLEEKGVKGRYASVERILELEDGNLEWRMATSSTPGGSIPTYFVERSLPGQIAEDVPHFLKWLHSLPKTE